jgi:hypothetical protein
VRRRPAILRGLRPGVKILGNAAGYQRLTIRSALSALFCSFYWATLLYYRRRKLGVLLGQSWARAL